VDKQLYRTEAVQVGPPAVGPLQTGGHVIQSTELLLLLFLLIRLNADHHSSVQHMRANEMA